MHIQHRMLPFTEIGSGTPVLLFVHYFGGSRREWKHVTQRLSLRYHCVAADMPGFGDASGINGYSVAEMAREVKALIGSFAPQPVVLIGHSMSGKVGMVLANEPPANLAHLVLVGPSPLQPEPMTKSARADMTIANTSPERAEEFVKPGTWNELSEADFHSAVDDVFRANTEAWKAWPQAGAREDWSDRIRELNVPTTLIVGEHDRAIPLDFQRQHTLPLVERAGGKLIVIQDAAHLLPYEAVAELTIAIENVVESIPL